METHIQYAIIGGGPAGSYLGYCLAKKGIYPVVFDDSHPREKPCGGGISTLSIEKFPILHGIPIPKAPDKSMELISPKGLKVVTKSEKESWCVSRLSMDEYLLNKSKKNGCKHISEHVKEVTKTNGVWKIKTNLSNYKADVIIGADGVNSITRNRILGSISKRNLGVCYGCFATSKYEENVSMKFLKKIHGYCWCFPRYNNLSIGIVVPHDLGKEVKILFEDFVNKYYPHIKIISRYGALIPFVSDPGFFDIPICGLNWLLVGDAAGHVDPITGEGITYALWGAELAANAIHKGNIQSYSYSWKKEFGKILVNNCKMRNIIYKLFKVFLVSNPGVENANLFNGNHFDFFFIFYIHAASLVPINPDL